MCVLHTLILYDGVFISYLILDDNWSVTNSKMKKLFYFSVLQCAKILFFFDVLRCYINVSRYIFCFYLSSSGFIGFQSPKTHLLSPLENYWILTIWILPFYLFSFPGILTRHICKFNILSSLFLLYTSCIWFTFSIFTVIFLLSHIFW